METRAIVCPTVPSITRLLGLRTYRLYGRMETRLSNVRLMAIRLITSVYNEPPTGCITVATKRAPAS